MRPRRLEWRAVVILAGMIVAAALLVWLVLKVAGRLR